MIKGLLNKKKRIIEAALKCQGWTPEGQLEFMYDLLGKSRNIDGDILEIGSAWGRSAVLFGLSSSRMLWSVDPHTGGLAYIRKGTSQDSYDTFLRNLEINGLTKKTKVLKATTQEVIDKEMIPLQARFAFVFIDGLHTAEGVKTDLELVMPRLSKGAIVVFDDYFEPSVTDMKEMIDSFVAENRLNLVKEPDSRLAYFVY